MNIKNHSLNFKVRRFLLQKTIDGKNIDIIVSALCIIFHHNLQRYVLLKWDKREPENISIGNVVKLKNPVAVGRQIFS